jgi:hypothetical protein
MSTITLHRAQSEVISHLFKRLKPGTPEWQMRFAVVVGSRGLGKSFVSGSAATLAVDELEQLDTSVPNKNIALLCGTHTQVTDIYWPMLAYQFGLESRCWKHSRAHGKFTFANGTEIRCWSADAYERMRGSGQYLVIADELPSWSVPGGSVKDAWESVLEPCLVTRWSPKQAAAVKALSPGRALLPSTPMGKDYFYDLAQREHIDDRWKTFSYTYRDSPLLSQEEIERARKHADPLKFAREYEASFEESGLTLFHTFSRKLHVDPDLPYFDDSETVHCAIDFNIMLNCTTFHAVRGGQLHALDESKGTANTEELARLIRSKFPRNKIICYPDPAGKARKTSAAVGVTDFSILREAGFTVLAKDKAPAIVDSVAAVNRKLLNAAGDVDFLVHPRCNGLISSLERTSWLENRPETATIDKTQGVEHYTDGVRYLVDYLWPLNNSKPVIVSSMHF